MKNIDSSKMILGIYHPAFGVGHDSAVALLDANGKILAAQSEERFSRIKMDGGFPFRSMEALKKMIPFEANDLAVIAVPFWSPKEKMMEASRIFGNMATSPSFAKDWISAKLMKDPFTEEMEQLGAYEYLKDYSQKVASIRVQDGRPEIKDHEAFLNYFGLQNLPRIQVDHHIAHVACAYYTSGWEECLIVTADGAGALKSGLVGLGRAGKVDIIGRTFLPNSPGRFWEVITHLCGFHHHKHGGKITGLAASGNKKAPCYDYFKEIFYADGMTMRTRLKPLEMKEKLGSVSREDIAATAQRRLEEVLCDVVQAAVKKTGVRKVALAGGVFGNVLMNQKIFEIPEVEDVYIYPAMGDEGLAVGAGLWGIAKAKTLKPYTLPSAYCGPEFSEEEMKAALEKEGLSFEQLEDAQMVERVAKLLSEDKVITYYEGKMEYGPRALGHRSVLYGTKDKSVNDWLNKRLNRSEFMPFAPVTLQEEVTKCYEGINPDQRAIRFMTITYQCTDEMKEKSPAVVHIDGTARPQVVTPENGRYYEILKAYHGLTGIPSIVNTSFNMHEEPIVCTPADAVRAYVEGGLDVLVLGPFLIEKNKGV